MFNPGSYVGVPKVAAQPLINTVTNVNLKPKINTLLTGDPYTTLGGKYGYYVNWLDRVRYTLDRSKPVSKLKAKFPELLRKTRDFQINSDGTV
jgi:hypothetical protein